MVQEAPGWSVVQRPSSVWRVQIRAELQLRVLSSIILECIYTWND